MNIKKIELINIIQKLQTFTNPKIKYEQYITDAISTADFMYYIAFEQGDLLENLIVDFGSGTGNLTIAALLLGAPFVIAVDIDDDALQILHENAKSVGVDDRIEIIHADLRKSNLSEKILKIKKKMVGESAKIITISNPPFGTQSKGADVQFLRHAFQFSDIIYSIHLSNEKSMKFLSEKIQKFGGIIAQRFNLFLILKHTYQFQSKSQKRVKTDVLRIINNSTFTNKQEEG